MKHLPKILAVIVSVMTACLFSLSFAFGITGRVWQGTVIGVMAFVSMELYVKLRRIQ